MLALYLHKPNTCEDGMMYDSNTDSCVKDMYKHIRDSIIPIWLKQTAVWWGQGMVTDDEFLSALQYLIDEGLLQISSDNTQDSPSVISENIQLLTNKIIVCEIEGTGQYVNIKGSITNNDSISHTIEVILYLYDSEKNMLTFIEHIESGIMSGQTVYYDRLIDYKSEFRGCGIELDQLH